MLHKLSPHSVRDRILRSGVQTVLGNHDDPDPRALHGTAARAAGLVVGGVGGSLPVGRFPFEVSESDYESLLARMGRVDVLVSHQPPYGTKCDTAYEGVHTGSHAIRGYVERERPRLVLSGHVHESPALDHLEETTIVNPGPFFSGHFAVAELGPDGVRASIKTL